MTSGLSRIFCDKDQVIDIYRCIHAFLAVIRGYRYYCRYLTLTCTKLAGEPRSNRTIQLLSFEQYLALIQAEAISEWRRYLQRTKRYVRFVD